LFGNQIENPGEISGLVEQLPYLKALWVNGNPVVENCVNFTYIGEYFEQLEIINSRFTSKAGDWALLFYARDQTDVKKVEDIRSLDLTAKGLLYMKDISIFERCTCLTTLDISGHPEFLMTEEEILEEEAKMKEGSP
jgi:tubulin--tyrosine ligase-like protein 12